MSANNSYEAMMVFSVKNGEEGVPALIEKFKALIEQNGTLDSIDEWGKRKLAYAIDDEPEDSTLCSISALHLSSPRSSTVSPV